MIRETAMLDFSTSGNDQDDALHQSGLIHGRSLQEDSKIVNQDFAVFS
jgi:hypothetical protein